MKIINDDTIIVNIDGVEREIKFTLGIDNEIVKIFSGKLSQILKIQQEMSSDISEALKLTDKLEDIEKNKDNLDEKKIEDFLQEVGNFNLSLNNKDSQLNSIGEVVVLTNELFLETINFLLTERDEYGNVKSEIGTKVLAFSDKYNTKEVLEELIELYTFANERFNKLIEGETTQRKKQEELL